MECFLKAKMKRFQENFQMMNFIKEYLILPMEKFMRENLKIINLMVKVFINSDQKTYMKVHFQMAKKMEQENLNKLMETIILENLRKIK